jgi:hypothetical protein
VQNHRSPDQVLRTVRSYQRLPGTALAMVSGYDKYGEEYKPPREPRPFRERVLILIVFIAAVVVGAWLGST